MVEQVSAYKSDDGRLFKTRDEAEKHEFFQLLKRLTASPRASHLVDEDECISLHFLEKLWRNKITLFEHLSKLYSSKVEEIPKDPRNDGV